MPYSKYTPKQKRLAAMYGNKKKITRGDVIAAAKRRKVAEKVQRLRKHKMIVKLQSNMITCGQE